MDSESPMNSTTPVNRFISLLLCIDGQGRAEGCVVREGGINGLNRAGYGGSKCVLWEVKWSQADYCHEHSSPEKYD